MTPLLLALALVATGPAWPPVSTLLTPGSLGAHDAAIVAGVGRPFVLPPIPGATESATDWYTWLTRTRGVPVENVQLLRDGDVTRERLLAAAEKARGQVGADGTLWIVFIGHGAPAPDGNDGLLLGVDAQRTELSLRERGLPQQALLDAAKGSQRATVAVFDACFSGMGPDGRTPLVVGSQATVPLRRGAVDESLVILSSSDEVAGPLPGHDRPAFTYLLLGALRGWADKDDDRRVTVDEAFSYTRHSLTALVTDKNQSPSTRGGLRDHVLSDTAPERGPDLIALIAAARAPPPPPVVTTPPVPNAGVPRLTLETTYRLRAIKRSDDHKWLRGDLPAPLSRDDLISLGRDGAPVAALELQKLEDRDKLANGSLIWVLPPVGGMILGAVGGGVTGGLLAGAEGSNNDWIMGGFIGSFVGAGLAATTISLPIKFMNDLDEDDRRRMENLEGQLANAANAAEREKLGLPPE